jgi:exosortase
MDTPAPEPEPNASGLAAFRADVTAFWNAMPLKAVFGSLIVVWLLLFQFLGNSTFGYIDTPSLFQWMQYSYNSMEDDRHGKYIPWVVLGLFWWKRRELLEVPKAPWWPALALVALALALHVVGFVVQQARLSIVGFFTGLYGLMGLVWGREWLRASFFPYCLVVFCLPLGTLGESITFPLRVIVTKISVAVSHVVLGIDVVRDGSRIFNPQGTFQYDVAPACSGIRSLIALLALTTIYGFVTFHTWWKQLLMVALAFPLAVVGNVARITGVIITGETFGQEAGMKFHDGAGFLTFVVAIAGVLAAGHWLREDRAESTQEQDP